MAASSHSWWRAEYTSATLSSHVLARLLAVVRQVQSASFGSSGRFFGSKARSPIRSPLRSSGGRPNREARDPVLLKVFTPTEFSGVVDAVNRSPFFQHMLVALSAKRSKHAPATSAAPTPLLLTTYMFPKSSKLGSSNASTSMSRSPKAKRQAVTSAAIFLVYSMRRWLHTFARRSVGLVDLFHSSLSLVGVLCHVLPHVWVGL